MDENKNMIDIYVSDKDDIRYIENVSFYMTTGEYTERMTDEYEIYIQGLKDAVMKSNIIKEVKQQIIDALGYDEEF